MAILELIVRKVIILLSVFCRRVGDKGNTLKLEKLLGIEEDWDPQEELEEIAIILEGVSQEEPSRYHQLLEKIKLSPLGISVLEFAITQVYFPETSDIVSNVFHSVEYFTIEDVIKVLGTPIPLEENYSYLKNTYEQLSKILTFSGKDNIFFRQYAAADKRLIGWLCFEDEKEKDICKLAEFFNAEETPLLYINQNVAATIEKAISDPDVILHITGEKNTGRKYLLKAACAKVKQNMMFVHVSRLMKAAGLKNAADSAEKLDQYLYRIKREMLFYDMGICFYDPEEPREPGEEQEIINKLLYCLEFMKNQPFPVCVATNDKIHLIDKTQMYVKKITMPETNRSMRRALWDGYCGFYHVDGIDTLMAAQKYRLNAGEIQKAVYRIFRDDTVLTGNDTDRKLAQICEEVLPSPVCGQIHLNKTGMKIQDLKIPEASRKLLLEICAQVNYRQKVFDEWGMEEKYPYGRNISALLVGPPGTGKTMAVDIISGMINLPVYKIDLSQVVDKYIGETEKKLEEVFNLAQKSNTILFFDEADSIFGKRSEVNEAKDRYANTEVSYILQRIEQYDGVVLLASNFKNNIDEAFLRRMRYLIEFPMPDIKTREEIWRGCFSNKVPVEDLDFVYLAKNFELSGGSIKNVVLNALFLAASTDEDVEMKHILISLRNEKLKMGKPMILSDFGQYAGLMMDQERGSV